MMIKWISLFLSLMLLLGVCGSALAAENRTLWYTVSDNGYISHFLQSALLAGNRVYCFLEGSDQMMIVYDLDTGTSQEYDSSALFDRGGASDEITLEMGEEAEEEEDEEEEEAPETENGQADTYETEEAALWFSWRDELYAVVSKRVSEPDGSSSMEGGIVRRLSLETGEPVLEETDLPRLDWSNLTDDSSNWVYTRYTRTSFVMEDTLCALINDDSGNDILCLISLTDGSCETRYLRNVSSLAAGPDGQVLVTEYNWDGTDSEIILSLYDPDSESYQRISSRSLNDSSVGHLYYRAENDTLYYTCAGEIWAAPGMDMSQAVSVNDCPLSGDSGTTQMTADGFLLMYDYQSVLLRDTDPSHRKDVSLTVLDSTYLGSLDSTYYDFTADHGDISVIIDRNYNPDNVLQGMMNQDSSVDIYILSTSSSQFNALFRRGFMAELESSEKLTSLVNSMYPAVSEAVKRDGRLVALPVYAYGYSIGISMKAFQKLGYTEDDVPKTWLAFFDLLDELPSKLEGSGVSPFMSW